MTAFVRPHVYPFEGSDDNPFASSEEYYGESHRRKARLRTNSVVIQPTTEIALRTRRSSHDEVAPSYRSFYIPVDETLERLLEHEDTDGNHQITIEDMGPKVIALGTSSSNGFRKVDVRGHYRLANLLQELTIAKGFGRKTIVLDEARLLENPVNRLTRLIKDEFWRNLTRGMDKSNILVVGRDPKDWTDEPRPRIYIPFRETEQIRYYQDVAAANPDWKLDVRILPENCDDPAFVRSLNDAPGILALAMKPKENGELQGVPFAVPGGRFNELYGWDSYFTSLGLLRSGRLDLVEGMITNFVFCIKHYGKILNANRSYYLCRSQPPFLTDMALQYYDAVLDSEPSPEEVEQVKELLRTAIIAAIKEYHSVWLAPPRLDPITRLSRYRPTGLGLPPETESGHFHHILLPYAIKRGMTIAEFIEAYNNDKVSEPDLDEYLLHDRAVRESGHDTSYRLEGKCANLATVDLNSCLFKIETDIANCIEMFFDGELFIPEDWRCKGMDDGNDWIETHETWQRRASLRMETMERFMWNPKTRLFHDYDTVKQEQNDYESVTSFWILWANALRPELVDLMVPAALEKFEVLGGLVSGTEKSRGEIRIDRPNRQWDYPFGWAPHQVLAWTGLMDYGYDVEAQRLMYKWLYMVTKAFVDYNGVVVEKYDVTREMDPHRVDAEYGNQGADFKGAPTEGFGWVNASYIYGLEHLPPTMRRAIGALIPWKNFELGMDVLVENDVRKELEEADDDYDPYRSSWARSPMLINKRNRALDKAMSSKPDVGV